MSLEEFPKPHLKPVELHNSADELSSRQQINRMAEVSPFSREELDMLKLVYPGCSNRELMNVFRGLRTELYKKAQGKNFVAMVTSVVGGGGSTYVAMNLASVIALDPAKTALLIDGNFHYPGVAKLMSIEPDIGLTEYLEDQSITPQDIIFSSGMPRVRVIPAGRSGESGAEHFASPRMRELLTSLRTRYPDRFVIIDAPAAGDFAEARILADLCDFVVLVVPYAKVTEAQIQSSIEVLGRERLAGIIFNNL